MINLKFKEALIDQSSENLQMLQNFLDLLDKLRKEVKQELNSLILEEKFGFKIGKDIENLFVNFLKNTILTSRIVNEENFFEQLRKDKSEKLFWDSMEKMVKKSNISYEETKFIREIDLNNFKSALEGIFSNNIIYNGQLIDSDQLSKEQKIVFIKVIEMGNVLVLEKRVTEKQFLDEFNINFGLNNDKILAIWETIQKNRDELMSRMLFSKLNDLIREVKNIKIDLDKVKESKENNFIQYG
jgi:uncharacterized protein YjgD (DUF1641 family)